MIRPWPIIRLRLQKRHQLIELRFQMGCLGGLVGPGFPLSHGR